MFLSCYWCIGFLGHLWEKWADTQNGDLIEGDRVVGHYIEQTRHCLLCGLIQMREVRR